MNSFSITGTKLWRNDKASFPSYSISIGGKNKDGSFVKPAQYISVRLPKDSPTFENGTTADLEGFLVARGYTSRAGEAKSILEFVVTKIDNVVGKAVSETDYEDSGFEAAIESIPF